ncbi:hypothetical protein [Massilia sp. TN1-12]|uniref:hypothetical protein n=1 Tax=Massilia paldalensis TaxID=3377675 RepID=UPI00384E76B9
MHATISATFLLALAAFSGSAHGADGGRLCTQGGCTAGPVASATVQEAIRGAARETGGAGASGRRAAQGHSESAPANASDGADAWKRALGTQDGREAYDCALSFGIGGAVRGDGFLGTRILGRTQVWRDK